MIRILFLKRTKEKFIALGIEEYIKRLKKFTNIEIVEVKSLDQDFKNSFLIVFDLQGRNFSSEEFAKTIKEIENKNTTIILGDENGIPKEVKEKANLIISISKMTFTHEMARLIIMEQLYRGFTIINNLKYHK